MKAKLITKDGREFHDPTPETIAGISHGIIWSNIPSNQSKVIPPSEWKISKELHGGYLLHDMFCQVRQISWGDYHPAIEFPSWEAYDHDQNVKALARFREENEKLRKDLANVNASLGKSRRALIQIHDINKNGGPKSRSKVQKIIVEILRIQPCPECERINCICCDEDTCA